MKKYISVLFIVLISLNCNSQNYRFSLSDHLILLAKYSEKKNDGYFDKGELLIFDIDSNKIVPTGIETASNAWSNNRFFKNSKKFLVNRNSNSTFEKISFQIINLNKSEDYIDNLSIIELKGGMDNIVIKNDSTFLFKTQHSIFSFAVGTKKLTPIYQTQESELLLTFLFNKVNNGFIIESSILENGYNFVDTNYLFYPGTGRKETFNLTNQGLINISEDGSKLLFHDDGVKIYDFNSKKIVTLNLPSAPEFDARFYDDTTILCRYYKDNEWTYLLYSLESQKTKTLFKSPVKYYIVDTYNKLK